MIRALTLIAPFAVMLAAAAAVQAWDDAPSRAAARRQRDHAPDALRATLTAEHPNVVFIGNSVTAAALMEDALDAHLSEVHPAVLTVPGAMAPTWYLVARNVVLQDGVAPRMIALVNVPAALLAVRPGSERELAVLQQFMDGEDPRLDAIMGVGDEPWRSLWHLQLRRAMSRDAALDGARDLAIRLSLLPGRGWLNDRDLDASVVRSFEEVFPPRDAQRPGIEVAGGDFRVFATPMAPEQSFLPAIAELAAARGASLLVVPTPAMSPDAQVPDELADDLARWCREHGVFYADLARRLDWQASDFQDPWHLGQEGSRRLTRAIAPVIARAVRGDPPAPEEPLPGEPEPGDPTLPNALLVEAWPAPIRLDGWQADGACRWTAPHAPWPELRAAALDKLPVDLLVDGAPAPRGAGAACDGTWRITNDRVVWAGPDAPAEAALTWRQPTLDGGWGDPISLWLPPGAQIAWRLTQPGPAKVAVEIAGRSVGEGDHGAPRLGVGRDSVPLVWSRDGAHFRRVRADTTPDSPRWMVRLLTGDGGPLLELTRVAVRLNAASVDDGTP